MMVLIPFLDVSPIMKVLRYLLIVTLYVCIQYGYRIPDVVLRLQERIKTALVSYTEIEVQTIDVVVQDIIFDDLVTPQHP